MTKKKEAQAFSVISTPASSRTLTNLNVPDTGGVYDPQDDVVGHDYGQVTPPVAATGQYDAAVLALSAEYDRGRREILRAYKDQFLLRRPEATGLRINEGRSYISKPRPSGYANVPPAIIRQIMVPGWLERTQVDVLAEVQHQFQSFRINKNIWTEEQKPWQLKRIRGVVLMGPEQYSQASVTHCKTLSSLRKAIRAYASGKVSTDSYKATITITDDVVTINRLPLKVTVNRTNGKEYRRVQVSIDKLLEALRASK